MKFYKSWCSFERGLGFLKNIVDRQGRAGGGNGYIL